MKSKLTVCMCLFVWLSYGQSKVYTFLIEASNGADLPSFTAKEGRLIYEGSDKAEGAFFSRYSIVQFRQAFPASKRERTLQLYEFQSANKNLAKDLLSFFPSKWLRYFDITDFKIQPALSYTNDYGTTNPGTNLGPPYTLANFDYLNVPKAWDYGYGNEQVKIGISDGGIDADDIDFKFKTTGTEDYQQYPYEFLNGVWHGTSVAAVAAAQGNNAHGTVGICSNCSIIAAPTWFGDPGTEESPTPAFNNLLKIAIAGAKVINMSWGTSNQGNPSQFQGFSDAFQWVIDELHDDYNMVLVAAAGNNNSFSPGYDSYNNMIYEIPASFDHVISVSSICHSNMFGEQEQFVAGFGMASRYVKDMIAPYVVTNYGGNGFLALPEEEGVTTNDRVDILAPGYQTLIYSPVPELSFYGGATSIATPHVSGTIGLMFSINPCLVNDEVEDILQLTSKRVEHLPGNEPFVGRSGSGKLETGDALQFVDQMMDSQGTVNVDGQDFWRFDFKLEHVMGGLHMEDQTFRDNCTADFTVKGFVDIADNVDLKPNETGFVDLKIDANIQICPSSPRVKPDTVSTESSVNKTEIPTVARLFPNPNNGTFRIQIPASVTGTVTLEMYDVRGGHVFTHEFDSKDIHVENSSIPAGL
ncbi:MAG TPA: S8 family serine peptidase, partial [Flavobacterium sp.]|nr:S8 family serine peptidase [Flavobacterium sp.]